MKDNRSKYYIDIIKFIENNGWNIDREEAANCKDFITYWKQNNIAIDVSYTEIVLIDDTGDYCHIPIDSLSKYTLLGKLLQDHAISMDYWF